jgi:para-aminobenzoate synthetase component 1
VTLVGSEPVAYLGGQVARDLIEVSDDPSILDRGGRWAVAVPYDGLPVFARFRDWHTGAPEDVAGAWCGPATWSTSLDRDGYVAAVERIRDRIAAGEVYQANVCRVLSASLPDPASADVGGLHALLVRGNPAPHSGMIRIPGVLEVASASPELFLARQGDVIETGPIKGTGRTAQDLLPKDRAENVHPGLVHLVSRVRGVLTPDATWSSILGATFPPGSVTGAPKLAAMECIAEVETASRGIYCGAVGWVDADAGTASLGVAIRTFWVSDGEVRFGTGAGITWLSDPLGEWHETELKADRLVAIAGGSWQGRMPA